MIAMKRCEDCGQTYLPTAGDTCGQNQPVECRGQLIGVEEIDVLRDVVSALRLALVAGPATRDHGSPDKLLEVVERILDEAPETDPRNVGGVELLVRMAKAQRLRFEVTSHG